MTAPLRLRRNRDFLLLQAGQLLSELGHRSTAFAYPLVVLAMTGSATLAGAVLFVRLAAVAIGVFVGLAVALAVAGMLNRALRAAPRLEDLKHAEAGP